MHQIVSTTHGDGAKQAMAKRKLDALGNVRAQCGFANDPVRMKKLKNQLCLADSLGEINRQDAAQKAATKSAAVTELVDLAPSAIATLARNDGELKFLTKDDMRAVAFVHFGGLVLKKVDNKPKLIEELNKLVAAQPTILPPLLADAVPAATTRPSAATTRPTATRKPRGPRRTTARRACSSDDDESEMECDELDEEPDELGESDEVPEEMDESENALPVTIRVAIGDVVHVPHSAFPDESEPEMGYWVGKTVRTTLGGAADIGIKIVGEPIFTRPISEVAIWVQ